MIKINQQILKEGEYALNNKWGGSILTSLTFTVIVILTILLGKNGLIVQNTISDVIQWIIIGPLTLGFTKYFLKISRRESPKYETIYSGFFDFKRAFIASFLTNLYTILRVLLLIIPGIIAALNYSLVYYILLDYPGISSNDAIIKSKKMMYGHKKQLFYLNLRFIGLGIICIFTLFIGFLWLLPYIYVCNSIFYDEVKKQFEAEKVLIN
jgi:uncharacterized membrane protein